MIGGVPEILKGAKVLRVDVYTKSRRIEVLVSSDKLIPASSIAEIEKQFAESFKLDSFEIKVKYAVSMTLREIFNEYWESLAFEVNRRVASSIGIFSGCSWELHENKLLVKLKTQGCEILKLHKCDKLIEHIVEESFSRKIKVEFEDFAAIEALKDEYLEFKENEEAKLARIFEEERRNDVKNGNGRNGNGRNGNGRNREKQKQDEDAQNGEVIAVIHGKNFSDGFVKISEINEYSGKVAFCGDIFSVDFREIRGGRYICIFDATDYSSSITVKLFIEKGDIDARKEQIRENIAVKVRGEAQYDKFSREITVAASDVVEIKRELRCDAAAEKRVELHLHTQMSAMDAVTPAGKFIERASQWGHKAIAITDHGVVQAFPDAYEAAKKHKIKVIYGIECYLADDGAPVVYNSNSYSVDEEFAVLDIETTGLNAKKDKITEIAAVKVKKGSITGRFSSFVNPGISIPDNIKKLTGISDEMVMDSPPIREVLPDLLDFIGNLPIVAHNSPFDMGFIKHSAQNMGILIANPVIDTLQMSRRMFPRLERHRLDAVAKHLGIKQENHHRAQGDSEAAAKIFSTCIEMLKKKGVKTLDDMHSFFSITGDSGSVETYHAIILIKNHTGLKNLYRLVSDSHIKYFYKKPRIPKSLIVENRDGLLLGSACEAGELYTAIINGKSDEELAKIAGFYDYLEIQPLCNNRFLINSGRVNSLEELKNANRKVVELGEMLKKPVAATCDVHFLDPRDEVFRRILMAGQGYEEADNQAPLYFRTTDEMLDEFAYLGMEKAREIVIENTCKIADMIEDIVPIPEGTFPPKIEGAETEIREIAQSRAREIYGEPLPEIVEKRLWKELNSIILNGFSVMYIIARKLVAKSLSDGYLVGSRGSVGSSLVAYLAGITEVNSLPPHYVCPACKYSEFITDGSFGCGFDLPDKECPSCKELLKKDGNDIPFETFLGFEGDKEPDIDLNFSGEYQPAAHKYAEELFGCGHVYRAGTIATIADKTAYGFVKNYLDEKGIAASNAEINRLVKGCAGVKKTTGQHPGGIMIVPQDKEIFDFCPIQHPADDSGSNVITTHFDYHSISGRLLKLDILGHDDPTMIKMLEDLTGIDAKGIPLGEERTMEIFRSTEPLGVRPEDIGCEVGTIAIPEFGTKFVRQMLVDTRPTTFSELVRISGLSHGTDVWLNNAQDIIKSNIATLTEVICTRDDIMLYLIHKGLPAKTAFKIMEDVRKGKGLKAEYEELMKQSGIPGWYAESCRKIKYMFPKAHAAAYVMMAFRIAWFKVYYPEAFYVAYFTVRADEFDAELMTHGQDRIRNKIAELEKKGNDMQPKEKNMLTILEVVNEMYSRGIKFLPVDLYKSDPAKFEITPQGIRPPLNALQGLGISAAQNIAAARGEGEFLSIDDLRIKAKVSKTVIEILKKHGCLEGMPESNQISLFGFLEGA